MAIIFLYFALFLGVHLVARQFVKRGAARLMQLVACFVLLFGFFGGAVGALTGMRLFHHKTKKPRFWIINILGLVWQIAFCIYLYKA